MTERPRGREVFSDIGFDTLVRVRAAALLLGTALVDSSNPLPVALTNPAPGGQTLLVDDITGALTTIPVVHHEVHEGETFQSSYKSPDANPIADDANIDILLQTGAKYAHLVFDIRSGGTAEILLYEDTTVNNVGTALVEYNMKRYSAEVATVTATHTPTINNVGTLLHNSLIPGGAAPGQNRIGGAIRANTEWILNPNSIYLVRGTNRAGNAQPMSNATQWYEESTP